MMQKCVSSHEALLPTNVCSDVSHSQMGHDPAVVLEGRLFIFTSVDHEHHTELSVIVVFRYE